MISKKWDLFYKGQDLEKQKQFHDAIELYEQAKECALDEKYDNTIMWMSDYRMAVCYAKLQNERLSLLKIWHICSFNRYESQHAIKSTLDMEDEFKKFENNDEYKKSIQLLEIC